MGLAFPGELALQREACLGGAWRKKDGGFAEVVEIDVEDADRAESTGETAKLLEDLFKFARVVDGSEKFETNPEPAGGDAHAMDDFRIVEIW